MQGKIVKGIAGFYYVNTENKGIFECKAKGAFRNYGLKPLVGDNVEIEILDENLKLGNMEKIIPRTSEMIRPACANVDAALVIFSVKKPNPNFNLLDRFLIYMEYNHIPTTICFNKEDLISEEEKCQIMSAYEKSGYRVLFVSAKEDEDLSPLKDILRNKTTVVAGPSGVGKSSLINRLCNSTVMQTGDISVKTERGKHTTRHSELLFIEKDTYIMDTPGFTSLDVLGVNRENLKYYYNEFEPFFEQCKFHTCTHISEPDCAVKNALSQGIISSLRYENYVQLYSELEKEKRY